LKSATKRFAERLRRGLSVASHSRPQLARIYAARLARLHVLRVTRASEALLLHFGKRDR
jgi:hypothetical protein